MDRSPLFGLSGLRPRLAVVLAFLTVTVVVVGYHISGDSAARRLEGMGEEALRIFSASRSERTGSAAQRDPADIEGQVRTWTGVKLSLPRDEGLFSYNGVTREKAGKLEFAAIRLTFAGEPYLLVVMRPETQRGAEIPSAMFSESSFLSWEKGGISFVLWERDGVRFMLVSDADLTHTFDLVRRYFT
jgi:hypothetical protein